MRKGNLSWVLPFTPHYSRPACPGARCICRAAGCDWRIDENAPRLLAFLTPCSVRSGEERLAVYHSHWPETHRPTRPPIHSPSTSSLNRWPEQNGMAADMILTMPP
ncbi:unnamed protein product [Arctogadus glacialis]